MSNYFMWFTCSMNSHQCDLFETYYVPTTVLVVLPSVLFGVNIFASPKSEILGFISLSKRMLPGLRSRCMTRNLECLCRQRSPCDIPSIIAMRLFQSSKALLFSSANQLVYFSRLGYGSTFSHFAASANHVQTKLRNANAYRR